MKKFSIAVAVMLVSALAIFAAGRKGPDVSKLPPPVNKPGLTFENDIKAMLDTSCINCHGAEKPKAKFRVDSRAAVIKGGDSDEPAVIPGNSAKSPMVLYVADLVEDMEMPPLDKREKNPALTEEQIGVLRAWIDQGAK